MSDLASGVSVGRNPFSGKSSSLSYPPMSILVARFLAVKGQHTGLLGFSFGVVVITILALLSRRLVKPGTPSPRAEAGAHALRDSSGTA